MKGRVFFDTNILVYAAATETPKAIAAQTLVAGGGVISVQVLNEFASVARRKLKWSWPDMREALTDFKKLCPKPLSMGVGTHDAAAGIAARDGLAFYDALIVASALEGGCATLLTEDMQDGRVMGGRLTIRNPFARP